MLPVNPVLALCTTLGAWVAVALPLLRVKGFSFVKLQDFPPKFIGSH